MQKLFDIVIGVAFLLLWQSCRSSVDLCEIEGKHYIAHAGGTIQGYRYSNSLEAVNEALRHDMEYIELDLCFTSDSQLVAWHDWNWQWTYTPTYEQFMSHPVYDRFTPMDFARIDSILQSNPQLSLVTDKISDPEVIERYFSKYKKRVWVECFTDRDYYTLQDRGYHVLISCPLLPIRPRSVITRSIDMIVPIRPIVLAIVSLFLAGIFHARWQIVYSQ